MAGHKRPRTTEFADLPHGVLALILQFLPPVQQLYTFPQVGCAQLAQLVRFKPPLAWVLECMRKRPRHFERASWKHRRSLTPSRRSHMVGQVALKAAPSARCGVQICRATATTCEVACKQRCLAWSLSLPRRPRGPAATHSLFPYMYAVRQRACRKCGHKGEFHMRTTSGRVRRVSFSSLMQEPGLLCKR